MKIHVTVKTNAKQKRVELIDKTHVRVSVKAPPKEGRANEEVLKAVSKYFNVPKLRCTLVRGHRSKQKVVEIL